jgi:fucose permease
MAGTTYWMLQTTSPTMVGIAVFCAGLAMAPVFPTTLGVTGDVFQRATATAMGIVITFGWVGLAVSSRIIGAVAGDDPAQLRTALMIIPAFSAAMILVSVVIRAMVKKPA